MAPAEVYTTLKSLSIQRRSDAKQWLQGVLLSDTCSAAQMVKWKQEDSKTTSANFNASLGGQPLKSVRSPNKLGY